MKSIVFNRILTASQAWCAQFTVFGFVSFQTAGQWWLARGARLPHEAQVHWDAPSLHLPVFSPGLPFCCEQGPQWLEPLLVLPGEAGTARRPLLTCRGVLRISLAEMRQQWPAGEIPEPGLARGTVPFSSFPSYLVGPDRDTSLSLFSYSQGTRRGAMLCT